MQKCTNRYTFKSATYILLSFNEWGVCDPNVAKNVILNWEGVSVNKNPKVAPFFLGNSEKHKKDRSCTRKVLKMILR